MKIVNYNSFSIPEQSRYREASGVTELHWDDGRVVQISGAEDDDSRGKHIMIRLFPENGTAEYGGGNLDSLTLVLEPYGKGWKFKSIHYSDRA